MNKLFRRITRENMVLFFSILTLVGLMTSRALISIGMMASFLVLFIPLESDLRSEKNYFKALLKLFKQSFLSKKALPFFALIVIFLIALVGGLNSENGAYFLTRVRLKLPFLALPLIFATIKPLSKKQFWIFLFTYVALIVLGNLWALFNYTKNFEIITESILKGKSIPTPFDHIRFSLMTAFAALSCIYFILKERGYINKLLNVTLVITALFLTVMLHVLSVRSGIFVFYIGLLIIGSYLLFIQKNVKLLFQTTLLFSIIFLLLYLFVPSLKNKVLYVVKDFEMYQQKSSDYYSDTRRIVSIAIAIDLFKNNFWSGCGTGDIKHEVNYKYAHDFPAIPIENRVLPHNQYLWIAVSNGIFGLFAFISVLVFVFQYNNNYKNLLFFLFFTLIVSSMIVESTLEIQIGVAFTSLFLCIFLNYLNTPVRALTK